MLRETWPSLRVSTAYQNPAVGFEGEDFINLVAGFQTDWPLSEILARLHAIEAACARPRDAPKWGPRSMDLDVLTCGELVGEFPGAVLPRPDLLQKPYMLGPMAELAPALRHPTDGRSMRELWAAMGGAEALRPVSLEEGA